jgi:gamma-glutamylcyclotransferase (GGCT)/AIG2-like uncharacterized protein YtfP
MPREPLPTAMPNYFAAYGTLRRQVVERAAPAFWHAIDVGPCVIPGRLYQMGGYPVLKLGAGRVKGELLRLPMDFDFAIFDRYEDYHPLKPWACRYLRRRVRLIEPKVEAWLYRYAWPADAATLFRCGDWLAALDAGVRTRRFRGDRRPIADYRPERWPNQGSEVRDQR